MSIISPNTPMKTPKLILLMFCLCWHLAAVAQWNTIYFPSSTSTVHLPFLETVEFVNAKQGFAAGATENMKAPIVVKTEDGGAHWDTIYLDTLQLNGLSISDLCFTNASTAHLIGGKWSLNTSHILSTTDFGKSWTTVTINATNLHKLFFTDANTGYAIGQNGAFFKTLDGGATWQDKSLKISDYLASIYFTSKNVGYVTSRNKIHKTIDGGNTWTTTDIITDEHNALIYFSSKNIGYYVSQNETVDIQGNPDSHENVVYKTIDGGGTWNLVSTHPSFNFNSAMQFTDDNTGYIVGFFKLLKTTDGGVTWTKETSSKPSMGSFMDNANDIFFLDGTGYAVGYDQFYTTATLNPNSYQALSIQQGARLYPNPANSQITVELTEPTGTTSFSLFSMSGQQVVHQTLTKVKSEIQLPETLENGIYQAMVQSKEGQQVQKLTVIR